MGALGKPKLNVAAVAHLISSVIPDDVPRCSSYKASGITDAMAIGHGTAGGGGSGGNGATRQQQQQQQQTVEWKNEAEHKEEVEEEAGNISAEDGLPLLVCSSCRDQLDACHRFRRVAHRTQKSLQSYLAYTATLCGMPTTTTTNTTTIASDYRLNSIGGNGNCLRVSGVFRRGFLM
ncbi:hypothetical protein AND_005745 [Anopheles darlingi]|uniref:ZAD domain-containing protein n=1 Tax=Anopheles darlingi TaxID=43151 RepID=W5JIE2_ANODA|nr:hypothetical protein AND_005745 [Anopheles darlingi]